MAGYLSKYTGNRVDSAVGIIPSTKPDEDSVIVVGSTGASSYKPLSQIGGGDVTQSDLNLLGAKINENIIRLPNVTYLVVGGNTVTLNGLTNQSVDWGDGVIEQGGTGHNYNDGINVHLIGIKGLNIIPNGFIVNSENLRKVYLAPTVNEIGQNAFGSCSSLQEVIITPDSDLAYIGADAFRESGLTSIVIPSKVATIDTNAFKGVPLEKIISYATTPPALDKDFAFENQSLTKIIVPKESINAYKTDGLWSQFANIIVYEVDSSDLSQIKGTEVEANSSTSATQDLSKLTVGTTTYNLAIKSAVLNGTVLTLTI